MSLEFITGFEQRFLHLFNDSILFELAKSASHILWKDYLQGQYGLQYRVHVDKRGNPTIKYKISKRGKYIQIRYAPLNLWERGFTRYGRSYSGLYIFEKFGMDLDSNYLAVWTEAILNRKIESKTMVREYDIGGR